MTGFGTRDVAELKLGKVAEEQMAEVDKLFEELNPYAYSSQLVRFIEAEIDQARAAGVLIEFEHGAPIITDRKLYRELVKQALKRAVEEYRDKAAAAKEAKAAPQAPRRQGQRSTRGGQARSARNRPRARRPGARGQPRPQRRADPWPVARGPQRHGGGPVLRAMPTSA
jgi:hypothetical protein